MTTLSDLALILFNPVTGKAAFQAGTEDNRILGAAAVYDLVDRGRIGFQGRAEKAKAVVLDPSPVPEPSLQFVLGRVQKHRARAAWKMLDDAAAGWGVEREFLGGLVAEGHLTAWNKDVKPQPYRYVGVDQARRTRLLEALQNVLFRGTSPDELLRRLGVMLAVMDNPYFPLLDVVADWPKPIPQRSKEEYRRRQDILAGARQRARAWGQGDPVAEALKRGKKKSWSTGGSQI